MEQSERDVCVRALYESVRGRSHLTLEAFSHSLSRFDLLPVVVRGEVRGAVMVDGNEIHVGVEYSARGGALSRRLIRKTLGAILDAYGTAVTAVASDNPAGVRFVHRLGFEVVRQEAGVTYFEARVCRHV